MVEDGAIAGKGKSLIRAGQSSSRGGHCEHGGQGKWDHWRGACREKLNALGIGDDEENASREGRNCTMTSKRNNRDMGMDCPTTPRRFLKRNDKHSLPTGNINCEIAGPTLFPRRNTSCHAPSLPDPTSLFQQKKCTRFCESLPVYSMANRK